jgi:hypothetical protein
VEAWQHVKLTSTNCSIGLIAGCLQDPSGSERQPLKPPRTAARFVDTNCFDLAQVFLVSHRTSSGAIVRIIAAGAHTQMHHIMRLDDLVAIAGGPHPIPFRTRP